MNSHDRRIAERYWPHCINVSHDDHQYYEIIEWLNKNLGSCNFKRRNMPRWCWRPNWTDVGNFSRAWVGTQLFFHQDKDFMAFLLKWDNT